MKKVKISFDNLKLGPIFSYLFLVLISSLLIVICLISLPLTEQFQDKVSYNLITKENMYWSKEYTLELETSQVPEIDRDGYIEKTRDILFRRLNRAGVEEVSVTKEISEEKDVLKVTVKSSKNAALVDNLVQNRFKVNVVTRKEDVDFDNEEDPYAYLLGENYNKTDFDGSTFRNVLITELRNSSGEYSFFAIFKPNITKKKAFDEFLDGKEGETIGVDTDGFVTPYYVPDTNPKTFAIPVTGGESQSTLLSLLYNSGEIPLSYTATETRDLEIENDSLNYIQLSIAILVAIVIVHLTLLFVVKEDSKNISRSLLSTMITISTWIAYLKISSTPIDTWLLALECILSVILIYVLIHNKESQIAITTSMVISFFIMMILGIGYMRIFGKEMILLLLISQFSIAFGKWYLDNMRKNLGK